MNNSLVFGLSLFAVSLLRPLKYFHDSAEKAREKIEAVQKISHRLHQSHQLLMNTDVFIFDCDGVIWKGDILIERAKEAIDFLRKMGKKVFFFTNNSTKSRVGFRQKFENLGLQVSIEELFSSSFAAALYLEKYPLKPNQKVYYIGQEGIRDELQLKGIPCFGGPEDNDKILRAAKGVHLEVDHNVGAVVVGLDQGINYHKIQYAQLCINEIPGCRFIATNLDQLTHLTAEQEWAGAGCCVGAIKGCTGKEPIVVGKPSSLMIDYLVECYNVKKDRICMVGDRLDTDILFGLQNGLSTILTLSGVTSESTLFATDNHTIPDYYVQSIADIMDMA